MKPVRLEVIAPILQGSGLCSSCELVLAGANLGPGPAERAQDEYPPEWQQDYQRLIDWVYDLSATFGSHLTIKVIDPRSPEGLLKSVKYRVRHHPTWIVNGQKRIRGWDHPALEAALSESQDTHQDRDGA